MHLLGPAVTSPQQLPAITHNSDEAKSRLLYDFALLLTPESEEQNLVQVPLTSRFQVFHDKQVAPTQTMLEPWHDDA